jgi:DNA polymerase-3 subunit epsilon
LWQFYQKLLEQFSPEEIFEAVHHVSKRPSVPPNIKKEMVESLPEKPGVYIFYGEESIPLYIGKSINIKERVFSHFANINESARELAISQQIRKIDYQETSGELGALLLESKLVKEMQPIYNRKLRRYEEVVYILKDENKKGYFVPIIKTVAAGEEVETDSILAIHKTKSQAKKQLQYLQEEYLLCNVLLGLEKSSSGCFDYKLGRCNGACLGKEKAKEYNERFEEAFEKTAIQPWPYEKPVLIHEVDFEKRAGENHVFHNWQYLGAIKYDQDNTAFSSNPASTFDYDMYMILKKYLRSHTRVKQISLAEIEKLRDGIGI